MALVVIAHRGEAGSVAGHQHQGVAPGGEHRFVDAGKTEQHHAVNIAPGEHAEMLLHQRRGELALHHNRIVTLLIKGGQHGLHGKVFRQRIETGDDNRHHFIALPRMARAEREGEKPCCCITASTRSRVRSLTPLSLLRTRDTVDFPTPLKRAISLMVSRFCMRNSRQGW